MGKIAIPVCSRRGCFTEIAVSLLLTPAELAAELGLAVQTIYNRINNPKCGPLPPITRLHARAHPRFSRKALEAWLEETNCSGSPNPPPAMDRPAKRGRPTKAEQIARRSKHLH